MCTLLHTAKPKSIKPNQPESQRGLFVARIWHWRAKIPLRFRLRIKAFPIGRYLKPQCNPIALKPGAQH
jgi:hypothetical protein